MDYQTLINDLLPGKTLKEKFEKLEKATAKKKIAKPKKIRFCDSDIYDRKAFKARFPDWPTAKLKHYYESADAYSEEGNLYVNWDRTLNNWASRDDAQGRFKWPADPAPGTTNKNHIEGLIL